ncbi:hypothetical protein B7P43_G00853 [Cryptotermes secundus]|uniref:Ig-like domain-containing protein n=1 Tax=Cryptotermes secundus TaxID=105785 RepID=A0A2J7PKB5_9NEOP|nr:hypothetical protein B7P43_G00853 [Cryptotermes secundus]
MHTVRDQNARLECHFDLEGEALYSVKWYKDGNEFFRYVPRDQPPAIHNSTESQVVLKSVNLSSTGRYRCEVSAEAPSFQTVSDHGDMTVVDSRSKMGFTQPPIQWVSGALFPGREADHSPPSSAEVKKV